MLGIVGNSRGRNRLLFFRAQEKKAEKCGQVVCGLCHELLDPKEAHHETDLGPFHSSCFTQTLETA